MELYYDGKQQVYEETPYRGYLSTMPMDAHFGLGKTSAIDSMIVKWPDGKKQVLLHVGTNQKISVNYKDAKESYNWKNPSIADNAWFQPITDSARIHYQHKKKQILLISVFRNYYRTNFPTMGPRWLWAM
ncbi:MAG: ASPIC/UnbV domain-containing protein [Puia sp.]